MKNILILLCSLALCAGCATSTTSTRLMSYNIRNGKGMDKQVSLERIAEVINNANVDAVALQEVDSVTGRYPIDVAKVVGELTNMHPTYGASIDFMGGKYGIAVLTREKPLSFHRVPLPCRSEPRSLLIVELEDYFFCSTHLSLHAEDRLASIEIIQQALSQLDKPAILAGDLNATPDEQSIKLLNNSFQVFTKQGSAGPLTWPADKPEMEIDYIALYNGDGTEAEVTQHYVVEATIESDHRPIVAEINIKQ